MQIIIQLLLGFLLSSLIAWLAYRAGTLQPSGAWAALFSGGLIFGLGGLPWAVLLLGFFISSSALSRLFSRRKLAQAENFAKGSRRDAGQVFANGGLGAGLALVYAWLVGVVWLADLPAGLWRIAPAWPWLAFAGAMAAVNADTWATELGVLSRTAPRLITTGRQVAAGTSGAISLAGTLASLAGAAFIGLLALPFHLAAGIEPLPALALLGATAAAGLLASLIDSLLGATLQAIYWCPRCQKETERHPRHTCGETTLPYRGWGWMHNDWVNFGCSLVGAISLVVVSRVVVSLIV